MPGFSVKLYAFEFQLDPYKDALGAALETQMKKAMAAFVKAASAAVPFRTGFARGALQNLLQAAGQRRGARGPRDPSDTLVIDYLTQLQQAQEEVGKQRPTLSAFLKPTTGSTLRRAGREFAHKGRGMRIEYYRAGGGKILKTPQSGRQFATRPEQILHIDTNAGIVDFNFEVFINYYNFLDFYAHPRVRSAPWKSFFYGRAFFFKSIQESLKSGLPKIGDFFVEHEIKVVGETKSRKQTMVLGRKTRLT